MHSIIVRSIPVLGCIGSGSRRWLMWSSCCNRSKICDPFAGYTQPVSCKNVLRQSPTGPCHDSASRNRQWSFCCVAGNSLVCPSIAPVPAQPLLRWTLGRSPSTVHLSRRWKHMTILKMLVICIKCIISIIRGICIICIICIIRIICIMYIIFLLLFSQDCWIRLDPRFYTSLTTEYPYCMSSLFHLQVAPESNT